MGLRREGPANNPNAIEQRATGLIGSGALIEECTPGGGDLGHAEAGMAGLGRSRGCKPVTPSDLQSGVSELSTHSREAREEKEKKKTVQFCNDGDG